MMKFSVLWIALAFPVAALAQAEWAFYGLGVGRALSPSSDSSFGGLEAGLNSGCYVNLNGQLIGIFPDEFNYQDVSWKIKYGSEVVGNGYSGLFSFYER